MNITLTILLIIAFVIAPITASLWVCAPKWWKRHVRPALRDLRRAVQDRVPQAPEAVETVMDRAVMPVLGFLWKLILLPFKLIALVGLAVAGLVVGYFQLWGRIIYGVCPYVRPYDDAPEVIDFGITREDLRKAWEFLW